MSLNSHFHILNNITHIFIYTYFQKLQTTILKLLYQTSPKYLKIQILQKSQILAPLTTSPPRVNQATSKPTKPQFSTRPAIPRSVNPRFKQLCRCHPRRSQPHLSWSRSPISHGRVTSSSIFLCPNMGYCFPFTCCDFVNLLTILR